VPKMRLNSCWQGQVRCLWELRISMTRQQRWKSLTVSRRIWRKMVSHMFRTWWELWN
jgi:pyrD_sub1_fam: dihydroorotate dehydrogenase family protein